MGVAWKYLVHGHKFDGMATHRPVIPPVQNVGLYRGNFLFLVDDDSGFSGGAEYASSVLHPAGGLVQAVQGGGEDLVIYFVVECRFHKYCF